MRTNITIDFVLGNVDYYTVNFSISHMYAFFDGKERLTLIRTRYDVEYAFVS